MGRGGIDTLRAGMPGMERAISSHSGRENGRLGARLCRSGSSHRGEGRRLGQAREIGGDTRGRPTVRASPQEPDRPPRQLVLRHDRYRGGRNAAAFSRHTVSPK